jgi:hypothetical protein
VNVFSVGNTLYTKGPLLDEGGGSGGFGLSNSYTPPSLSGYQPPYTLLGAGPSSGGGDGSFWGDVQHFLQSLAGLNSLLDSYIFTEQERAWMGTWKALAEADKAKAEAEKARYQAQMAAKERARPDWLLVAGAVVVGGIVVYLLLNK